MKKNTYVHIMALRVRYFLKKWLIRRLDQAKFPLKECRFLTMKELLSFNSYRLQAEINDKNFPIRADQRETAIIQLIRLSHDATTEEVRHAAGRMSLSTPAYEHALRYAAEYPGEKNIVFLTDPIQLKGKDYFIAKHLLPELHGLSYLPDDMPEVYLTNPTPKNPTWDKRIRFGFLTP